MNRLRRAKRGLVFIFIMLLLNILFLGLPAIVEGGGISQPGDGLNSTPPPESEDTTTFFESAVLFMALYLIT